MNQLISNIQEQMQLRISKLINALKWVQLPEFKATLESVTHLVPGYVNQYYELPSETVTVPSARCEINKIDKEWLTTSGCLCFNLSDGDQTLVLAFNLNGQFIDPFDVDPSGRIPVFSIYCDPSELSDYPDHLLNDFLQKTGLRQWLTHPPIIDMLSHKRTKRFHYSAKHAHSMSASMDNLIGEGIIQQRNKRVNSEDALLETYKEHLIGLSNFKNITLDPSLVLQHKQYIAQNLNSSISAIEVQTKLLPSPIPLPFSATHILTLFYAYRIQSTLDKTDPYFSCHQVAVWLTQTLRIPFPLAAFIQTDMFYCHDVKKWFSSEGMNAVEDRNLLLPMKRLLMFIWSIVHLPELPPNHTVQH